MPHYPDNITDATLAIAAFITFLIATYAASITLSASSALGLASVAALALFTSLGIILKF